jgi:polar amino acid transport system substrate-binding protein
MILLSIFPAFITSNDAPKPENLTYMCEDIPPSNYLENGKIKGVSVEVLKLIWKKMGCPEQPIKVVPWARGYRETLANRNTVLFSMSRTREREKLFKWVGPIFTVKSVLLGLSRDKITVKKLKDARKYRIGTIRNDVTEAFLLKNGFDRHKVETVANLKQNFEKLESSRIDLIAHTSSTFREYIRNNGLDPRDFTIVYVLEENRNYYAFNPETPDSLIADFQKAFDGIGKERAGVLEKYGLSSFKDGE